MNEVYAVPAIHAKPHRLMPLSENSSLFVDEDDTLADPSNDNKQFNVCQSCRSCHCAVCAFVVCAGSIGASLLYVFILRSKMNA